MNELLCVEMKLGR